MDKFITIPLSPAEVEFIKRYAEQAEIGGRSTFRGEDRQATLATDQLVGQIGTYVLHKYLFGDTKLYRVSRYYANLHPRSGDGGTDIPGANVDVKATNNRFPSMPLTDFSLLVSEREWKPETVYVQCMVWLEERVRATLTGWVTGEEMRYIKDSEGEKVPKGFVGYATQVGNLNPLPPIRWCL